MKTILQRFLLMCLIVIQAQDIFADDSIMVCDFKIDGICYAYTGERDATGSYSEVNVTYKQLTKIEKGYSSYSYYNESVKIPSTVNYEGNEYKVTGIGANAFREQTGLKSVAIPNSVTHIDDYAFYDCDSLVSVNIPNGVTSIGEYAFSDCYSLMSIIIPDGVTTIRHGVFSWSHSLTSVKIPNSVTSIEMYAFIGCTSLTSVNIPDGVTSIEDGTFQSCI